jgi:hypothetical protein
MGLNASTWPRFSWIDGSPGPNNRTYGHWGYYMPQNILEPNNIFPPESCAGANYTQAYEGAWAWSDTRCSLAAPFICKTLNLGAFHYTSPGSGSTYVFNNTPVTQSAAAQACKDYGAAPVSFKSLDEQLEVEAHFLGTGRLLADAHKAYWLGLKAASWPAWAWVDKTAGAYNPGLYNNWFLGGGVTEPNNLAPPELCVVANASEVQRDAWGWADTSCGGRFPYMCKVVGTGASLPPPLTSNITGNVFQLYLNKASQAQAEAQCQAQGGHLACYASDFEQTEIESAYVQLGFLVPAYHKSYWVGLQRAGTAGFRWLDGSLPGPNSSSYQHWGTYKPGNIREPNNMLPSELCAVANNTQAYGTPPAWGWSDTRCSGQFVFICRQLARKGYRFTTSLNNTFVFNASASGWKPAEHACRDSGGHLASYRWVGASHAAQPPGASGCEWQGGFADRPPARAPASLPPPRSNLKEQVEVEQYFIGAGLIIPTFHKFYWMGLAVSGLWPNFKWVDRSPGPNATTYEHWGRYISTENEPEPNNFDFPPESCAGANYTESFGNPSAWGWADWGCDQPFAFMCEVASESPAGHFSPAPAIAPCDDLGGPGTTRPSPPPVA